MKNFNFFCRKSFRNVWFREKLLNFFVQSKRNASKEVFFSEFRYENYLDIEKACSLKTFIGNSWEKILFLGKIAKLKIILKFP